MQITQIEGQIEAIKQKIRDLRAQGDKDKEKDKDVAQAQFKKTQGCAIPQTEVNVTITMIVSELRVMTPLLKCLNSFAKVSDLKFSNEDKSQAFVKFILAQDCNKATIEQLLSNYGRHGAL